jgi:hypothetical protein
VDDRFQVTPDDAGDPVLPVMVRIRGWRSDRLARVVVDAERDVAAAVVGEPRLLLEPQTLRSARQQFGEVEPLIRRRHRRFPRGLRRRI